MADSLKLSSAAAILCLLAWSGALDALPATVAHTAAFLLYYLWPVMSLLVGALTAFFAVRDVRRGSRWQAVAALVLAIGIIAFSWTHFHGWE